MPPLSFLFQKTPALFNLNFNTMKLDPNKEYVYRNGEKPWKIIFDSPFEYCKITTIDKYGDTRYHSDDGAQYQTMHRDFDLIEVKPKIKGWVNVYSKDSGGSKQIQNVFLSGVVFYTKELANIASLGKSRIACIEIEFTEGEGL